MFKGTIPLGYTIAVVLGGCGGGAGPGQGLRYEPPNTEFAAGLGVTPPVTQDQAMAIAAAVGPEGGRGPCL